MRREMWGVLRDIAAVAVLDHRQQFKAGELKTTG
jgi:hypothetical protein